ncbi:MAG TPA: hypothetical protein VH599_10685 [Ktedonobacterales bacterium]|jgi:hypothetical protein
MLVTPSQIALYSLAALFALYLWVRAFTFPRGERRQAIIIAAIFMALMIAIVVVFSLLVPWLVSLITTQPITGLA